MPTAERGAATAVAPLLSAYRGEPTERVPVWFMRQAGRALPEYRAVRAGRSLVGITHEPEIAAEVTLQPVRRYGVDAAILFSDIVTPLEAIGVDLQIKPGVGPVIATPIRTAADLDVLRNFHPEVDAPWLAETVKLVVAELKVPLIGFVGGPFTLASYLVEGGPSKTQTRTRALMLSDPSTWRRLLEASATSPSRPPTAQVAAGAGAVQVFDSWIGSLSPAHYERHVLPVVRRLFARLGELEVPRIYFGVGTGHLLELMAAAGPDVLGIDWRVPVDAARGRVPSTIALQGNLDPDGLPGTVGGRSSRSGSDSRCRSVRGYVFNLGHGVLPETDPDLMERLAELVHSRRRTDRFARGER